MTAAGNNGHDGSGKPQSPRVDARFNRASGDDMEIHISVRNLVEFVLRSGSIDGRFTGRNRMEEGARVHKQLQKDKGYVPEVYLVLAENVDGVSFTVEGRADGIITNKDGVSVDEIKSTLTPLDKINEDFAFVHWAQAMCYGHMYCRKHELDDIRIRLTYYEMDTGNIKRFVRTHTALELETFFNGLLSDYAGWVRFEREWHNLSRSSMRELKFPFASYREGQRRLAAAVYKTIEAGERLLAVAPTGVGKTVSTLFPALKAMGETYGAKVFYLTAKTITRQAAQTALDILRADGVLRVKSVTITAKDKVCFLEKRDCRPELCEYANGHYDRINAALIDILSDNDDMTAEIIAEYANRHKVCPFEFALDLTLWCDVVICDYNYLFDPQVYLKRFFSESGDYIFLVDEAHNLPDRARSMWSESISKRNLLAAGKLLPKREKREKRNNKKNRNNMLDERDRHEKNVRASLSRINKYLLEKLKDCGDEAFVVAPGPLTELGFLLEDFALEFSVWLSENTEPPPELLETYFNVLSFIKIAEQYDMEAYATVFEPTSDGELVVRQLCVDPSNLLDARMKCGRSTVLFSATLTPPKYFASVLGCGDDCRYITIPSPFPRENMLLVIAENISVKYRDREQNAARIAEMIYHLTNSRSGNYIAYFSSYSYLNSVYTLFCDNYPDVDAFRQESKMNEDERLEFLTRFDDNDGEAKVGFCVLGGIFGEGIDLVGDKLLGTVVVGVGLPQLNHELDLVMERYNETGYGFDFAYRFPGMNKVLQAAGRVIRSDTDKGVVLLIDTRFASRQYTQIFPEHWRGWRSVRGADDLDNALKQFWK